MKSLFLVSSSTGYGGAERSAELIAGRLQQELRLTVFAESPFHVDALSRILRPPARLVMLRPGLQRRSLWLAALRLAAAVARHRPDAVLANTHRSAHTVALAARLIPGLAARSFIYVRDFMWGDLDRILAPLDGGHILVPSPALLERPDYLGPYLAPRGRLGCSTVPDMVPLPVQARDGDGGEGSILHLATVNPWKGHVHLIRAVALLRDSNRPLAIASHGVTDGDALRRALERQIAAAGLDALFHLGPYVADPSQLLRDCLGVVVTSVSHSGGPETFGRSIIEAWAHGKPVVAFAAGGTSHLIEHEVDGLLVPEGDETALAEALWRLRSDTALRRRLGRNGLEKVRRHYETDTVVRQLLATMRGRLGGG